MAIISSLSKGVGSSSTALACGAAVVVSAVTVGLVVTYWDGLTDGAEGSELVAYQDPEEDEGDVEEVSVQQDTTEWWWKNDNVNDEFEERIKNLSGDEEEANELREEIQGTEDLNRRKRGLLLGLLARKTLEGELEADVKELLSEYETEELTFAWDSADYYYQHQSGEVRIKPWKDAHVVNMNAQDVVPAVVDHDEVWAGPLGARKVALVDTEVNVWQSQQRTANETIPELREIWDIQGTVNSNRPFAALGVVDDMDATEFKDRLWSDRSWEQANMKVVTLDDLLTSHHQ